MIAAILIAAATATPPLEETVVRQCMPTEEAYAMLADQFGESPVAAGLTADGFVIELWASSETGTWTLFTTRPNGTSCALGDGQGIVLQLPEPPGEPV